MKFRTRQRKARGWPLHRIPLFLLAAIAGFHSDEIFYTLKNKSAKDGYQSLGLDTMITATTEITEMTKPTPGTQAIESSRPPECTEEQRSMVLKQLGSERCLGKVPPWYQRCSFSRATKVTDSTWLKSYYDAVRAKEGLSTSTGSGNSSSSNKFVAIFVGCQQGYEAVDALRMGTGDSKYNKDVWAKEIKDTNESNVSNRKEFQLREQSTQVLKNDDATVHCIDPDSATTSLLHEAVSNLGWNDHFFVTNIALSKETGERYFKKPEDEVKEFRGSGDETCEHMKIRNQDSFEIYCNTVSTISLDSYLQETATKKHDGRVHLMRIDAEGGDYDVLLGATETLAITEYLEFKYHWTGSWQNYNLFDAMKMLDGLGFTCYFGGTGHVWRIDESCWLDHYTFRSFANIACVNRLLNKHVADNMEETFIKTLGKHLSY